MPVPSPRNKILPARGNYADLLANVASLLDGEMCYAIDQDSYYQKEGTVLVRVGGAPLWEEAAGDLRPADETSNVLIGGTLPSAPNIQLIADGTIKGANYIQASQGFLAKQNSGYFFIGQSTSNVNSFIVESSGDVLIGGTLPSVPNIELKADGSAAFNSGQFNLATFKRTAAGGGAKITLENGNTGSRTFANDSSGHLFFGYNGDNQAAITNSGNLQVGGTLTSAPNTELNADGSATFAGNLTLPSLPSESVLATDANGTIIAGTAGGAVDSVNTQTGVVILDADDIDDSTTTNKFATAAQLTDIGTALQPADIGVTVQSYDADNVVSDTAPTFTATVQTTERTITAGAFDLATGNHWTCGAITVPAPTSAVAGTSGLIRITAGPVTWNAVFKFPGGSAPTIASFPAVIPFYIQSSSVLLMGNIAEGIS